MAYSAALRRYEEQYDALPANAASRPLTVPRPAASGKEKTRPITRFARGSIIF